MGVFKDLLYLIEKLGNTFLKIKKTKNILEIRDNDKVMY